MKTTKKKLNHELSETTRYHLGMCGEKLLYKLLIGNNVELLSGLGLIQHNIKHVNWYNELYNKSDNNWDDKSVGKGHDIQIITDEKTLYLEIKTSFNDIKYYDLTINEVALNNKYKDYYYVIKISNMKYLKSHPNKINVKIIKNPLVVFNNSNIIRSISLNL